MLVTVTTEEVELPQPPVGRWVVQNIGPGILYIDTDGDADASEGMKIEVGWIYEFPFGTGTGRLRVWAVSESTSEVRLMHIT